MYKIHVKGKVYQVSAQVLQAIRARGVQVEFILN
jgi:hypothetical protein